MLSGWSAIGMLPVRASVTKHEAVDTRLTCCPRMKRLEVGGSL